MTHKVFILWDSGFARYNTVQLGNIDPRRSLIDFCNADVAAKRGG